MADTTNNNSTSDALTGGLDNLNDASQITDYISSGGSWADNSNNPDPASVWTAAQEVNDAINTVNALNTGQDNYVENNYPQGVSISGTGNDTTLTLPDDLTGKINGVDISNKTDIVGSQGISIVNDTITVPPLTVVTQDPSTGTITTNTMYSDGSGATNINYGDGYETTILKDKYGSVTKCDEADEDYPDGTNVHSRRYTDDDDNVTIYTEQTNPDGTITTVETNYDDETGVTVEITDDDGYITTHYGSDKCSAQLILSYDEYGEYEDEAWLLDSDGNEIDLTLYPDINPEDIIAEIENGSTIKFKDGIIYATDSDFNIHTYGTYSSVLPELVVTPSNNAEDIVDEAKQTVADAAAEESTETKYAAQLAEWNAYNVYKGGTTVNGVQVDGEAGMFIATSISGNTISHNDLKTHDGLDEISNITVYDWGINDWINSRAEWQKQITSIAGEPAWFYFKIFFKFDTEYGLLGSILNKDNASVNTAWAYLNTMNDFGKGVYYQASKLENRIKALEKFVKSLSFISTKAPWFFKSVRGLDKANDVLISDFTKDKTIEITCNPDAIDMRLMTLIDLYKYVCYDNVNCREVVPENLRKFDMDVVLFQTPIKGWQTATKSKTYGDFDAKRLNTENGRMSFKMFSFKNCEFDTDNLGSVVPGDVSNETAFQIASNTLKIKYNRVYTINSNEFLNLLFGSSGIYHENQDDTQVTRLKALQRALVNINYFNPSSEQYKELIDTTESIISNALL